MINVNEFLNVDSNAFQTLITLLVGLLVFANYLIVKKDERKKAALVLIMEIRDIEERIENLKVIKDYYYTSPIITTNSWEKFKYLFAKDLDQDENKLITNFYINAYRIEQERTIIREQITIIFTEKARLVQENIAAEAHKCIGNTQEYLNRATGIADLIFKPNPEFHGQAPRDLLNILVNQFATVTVTSAGIKIKNIAGVK